MLTDIHNCRKEGLEGGCSWGSKRELLHRAEDMNKISKKDGTYVLEPGSGAFGFIICDMDGNVIGVARGVAGVLLRLSLLKIV